MGSEHIVEAREVCNRACAGYLLTLHPEVLPDDPVRATLDREVTRFLRRGGVMGVQQNWQLGFVALYLVERHLRGVDETGRLEMLVERIEMAQNSEGGWSHDAVLEIGFYPSTLIAATNLVLMGLGLARRQGR